MYSKIHETYKLYNKILSFVINNITAIKTEILDL